jgi:hypothetical protein
MIQPGFILNSVLTEAICGELFEEAQVCRVKDLRAGTEKRNLVHVRRLRRRLISAIADP